MMATSYTIGKSMTDLAYADYQAFADSALAYQRAWSRSGTRLQMKPVRNAMLWKIPTLPVSGSRMQRLPIRNARDWVDRSGLGGVAYGLGYKGYDSNPVQPVSLGTPSLGIESIALGAIIGWFIGKQLLK